LISGCQLSDDCRYVIKAGHLGGPHSPLAGDELISVQDLGDDDRLQYAVDGDARGQ
jgi:hypothetical protein